MKERSEITEIGEILTKKLEMFGTQIAPYAELDGRLRRIEDSLIKAEARDEARKELKERERRTFEEVQETLKGLASSEQVAALSSRIGHLEGQVAELEKAAAVDGVDLNRIKELERKFTFSILGVFFGLIGKIVYDIMR